MVEEIKLILEKVKGVPGLSQQLLDSMNIIEDVGLNSLQMMEFLLEVESQLSLEIDFESLDFCDFRSIERFSQVMTEIKNN